VAAGPPGAARRQHHSPPQPMIMGLWLFPVPYLYDHEDFSVV
jgi:hypothetical protein